MPTSRINLPGTSLERQIMAPPGRHFRTSPGHHFKTSPGHQVETFPGRQIGTFPGWSNMIFRRRPGDTGGGCPRDVLGTNISLLGYDIKSLYTNIRRDLFLTAIEYWIEHLQNNLLLLQRFTKQFGKIIFQQIKGTAMGTKVAVVGSNLVVVYKEIKLFVYPQYSVDFLLRNYFGFLDDIFHKWVKNFDIKLFYDLINSLDKDLKFIFENTSRTFNFLDIQLKIVNNTLVFDIY